MNRKHGLSKMPIYAVWRAMVSRCTNPNDAAYQNYGGRGIRVDDRWLTFPNFLHDMGQPPAGHCLERIDNDRGYSQGNCEWATRSAQNRNRRNTRMVEANGRTQSVAAWAEESGLSIRTICARLDKGWEPSAAVTYPLVKHRKNARSGVPAYQFGAERGVTFKEQ